MKHIINIFFPVLGEKNEDIQSVHFNYDIELSHIREFFDYELLEK